MMRHALVILSFPSLLLLTGCVYALRPYNNPSQQKLHVQTASPTNCLIRVADAETFTVATDGRVMFDVPRLSGSCDVYLLGFMKVRDGSPESASVISVLKDEKIVRKLSLQEFRALPVDTEGYHVLVLR